MLAALKLMKKKFKHQNSSKLVHSNSESSQSELLLFSVGCCCCSFWCCCCCCWCCCPSIIALRFLADNLKANIISSNQIISKIFSRIFFQKNVFSYDWIFSPFYNNSHGLFLFSLTLNLFRRFFYILFGLHEILTLVFLSVNIFS